jgi:hypothetical protein
LDGTLYQRVRCRSCRNDEQHTVAQAGDELGVRQETDGWTIGNINGVSAQQVNITSLSDTPPGHGHALPQRRLAPITRRL